MIEENISKMIAKAIYEGIYSSRKEERVTFDYSKYLTKEIQEEAQSIIDNNLTFDEDLKISKELLFVIFGMLINYGEDDANDPYCENISEDNVCICIYFNSKLEIPGLSDIENTIKDLIDTYALGVWIAAEYEYIEGRIDPYDPGDYWTPPSGGGVEGSDLDVDDIEILGIGEDLAYQNLLNYPEVEKVAQEYFNKSKEANRFIYNTLERLDEDYYERYKDDDGWCEDE